MSKPAELSIHLQKLDDMFIKPGMSFHHKKKLNNEIEEWILEESDHLLKADSITITFVTESDETSRQADVTNVVHEHFEYCIERTRKQLKSTLNMGWRSLFIGFIFLVLIFFLTRILARFVPESGFTITLRELFIILGWVALWRPAELLLYEWYPFRRNIRLFRKLVLSKIRIEKSAVRKESS